MAVFSFHAPDSALMAPPPLPAVTRWILIGVPPLVNVGLEKNVVETEVVTARFMLYGVTALVPVVIVGASRRVTFSGSALDVTSRCRMAGANALVVI